MAYENLEGLNLAILVMDGFVQVELLKPHEALDRVSMETSFVSRKDECVRGWDFTDLGDELTINVPRDVAKPDDMDAVPLSEEDFNLDGLRIKSKAFAFVKVSFEAGQLLASICHGDWNVIKACAAQRRRNNEWPSHQTDLRNAGASNVDQGVVIDANLVTSRNSADNPTFDVP